MANHKPRQSPIGARAREVVRPYVLAGKPLKVRQLSAETGVSIGSLQRAELYLKGELAGASPTITFPTAPPMWSDTPPPPPIVEPAPKVKPTTRKKLDRLEKQLRANLELEFERRVRIAVEERLAKRDAREAETIAQVNVYLERQGKKPFTAQEYTSVLMRALHPDTTGDDVRLEAFKLVSNRKLLLREEGRITPLSSLATPLPKTAAEWRAARQAVKDARRAKARSTV